MAFFHGAGSGAKKAVFSYEAFPLQSLYKKYNERDMVESKWPSPNEIDRLINKEPELWIRAWASKLANENPDYLVS